MNAVPNGEQSDRPGKRKRSLIAPPPADPAAEPAPLRRLGEPSTASPQPITPATARRAALAEQILLDAFRASWGMRTSDAKEVFGTPEVTAAFAVKAADALWTMLEQQQGK